MGVHILPFFEKDVGRKAHINLYLLFNHSSFIASILLSSLTLSSLCCLMDLLSVSAPSLWKTIFSPFEDRFLTAGKPGYNHLQMRLTSPSPVYRGIFAMFLAGTEAAPRKKVAAASA
ncbi:hypothetical protein PVK06_027869 [Gossypium arboreum]|uniref:Uncharacterized protein n=1 Tax=Gossypium arboreum TaxID=29729 RepID=A0ABR0P401_GOSAR|nr:hypothetical protein PVK06_027869 [Gossypium arboreum]